MKPCRPESRRPCLQDKDRPCSSQRMSSGKSLPALGWMAVLLGSGGRGGGCVWMVFSLLLRAWMDRGREGTVSLGLCWTKPPTYSVGPGQVGAMGERGQLKQSCLLPRSLILGKPDGCLHGSSTCDFQSS